MPRPVRKRASDIIEQELRRLIVKLELPPGALISEADLMALLSCGRTPLREALQRLAQEGLMVSVPRRGMFVAELSLIDYVQVIESIACLESFTARLAAQRGQAAEFTALETLVEQARQAFDAGDIFRVTELDYEFHGCIAGLAHNRHLASATSRLHRLTSRFVFAALQNGGAVGPSLDEHRQIVAALLRRDAPAAEQETCQHILQARDRMVAAISGSQNPLPPLGPSTPSQKPIDVAGASHAENYVARSTQKS